MSTPACQVCSQPSVYYCTCQYPAAPCCHTCSYTHQETPGEHSWVKFEQIGGRNIYCEICQQRPAEVVCCCRFPVALLCQGCRSEHMLKFSMKMHFVQPIEKQPLITSDDDIVRARRVLENKDRIEVYLNWNSAAAGKLKDNVTNLAEEIIVQVNSAKEATLKSISEFEAAIQDKRASLNQALRDHLFDKEGQSSDALIREAFDISKRFECTEVLQGELCRIGQIGPVLAQLHLPLYFRANEADCVQGWQQTNVQFPSEAYGYQDREVCAGTSPPDFAQVLPQSALQGISWSQRYSSPDAGGLYQRYSSSPALMGYMETGQALYSEYFPVTFPAFNLENAQLAQVIRFEVTQLMADSLHAPCREVFQTRTPEIPKTIGRHRLPIESLIEEYKWNEAIVRNLKQFAERYSSWRRSRGDGNSFYRCTGVLLCEHYCRPDTPLQELETTYRLMLDFTPPFQAETEGTANLSNLKLWLRILNDLYSTRKEGGSALQRLQYLLQKPQCDKAVITAMRQYTANYCRLYASDPSISAFLAEGPDPLVREILSDGKEAEGMTLMLTAKVLNTVLHVSLINNEPGQASQITYGPSTKGTYASMHLFHILGHYYILTPREWDVADRYDFTSNAYNPIATNGFVDYEEYSPG